MSLQQHLSSKVGIKLLNNMIRTRKNGGSSWILQVSFNNTLYT